MRRFPACSFTNNLSFCNTFKAKASLFPIYSFMLHSFKDPFKKKKLPRRLGEAMESQPMNKANDDSAVLIEDNTVNSSTGSANNIIRNSDFSMGLHSWQPNSCHSFIVSAESNYQGGTSANSVGNHAVVTKRRECWQGLEQDITSRMSPGLTYFVSASVGVSGPHQGSAGVKATLRLEHQYSKTSYFCIGKTSASKERWEKLEGTFTLSAMPNRAVFYLEGPAPGIDIPIRSVVIYLFQS